MVSRRIATVGITLLLLVFFLLPVYHLATMSLKTQADTFASPPVWLFSPTTEHYDGLLAGRFPRYMWNSFVVSVANVALTLALGAPAAFALARARVRGRKVILFAILATRMMPPISLALPVFVVFLYGGLLDTRLGLVLIFLSFNLPLTVWLLHGFFSEVPDELLDAARIDGASVLRAFFNVAVPYVASGIVAVTILAWIYSWNEFTFTLILTRRDAITATVALGQLFTFETVAWGRIAAGGSLTMFPVMLLAVIGRRYFVRGLTGGGLTE